MKKIVFALCIILAIIALFIATGCSADAGFNKQMFDLTYEFDEAIIAMPNGEIVEGKVQSWTDFEDGDQLQVKIDNVTYLTHSENIVLIAKGEN